MASTVSLGRSDLEVPLLGVGAMTWGDPSGLARWTPAKLSYGGAKLLTPSDGRLRAGNPPCDQPVGFAIHSLASFGLRPR